MTAPYSAEAMATLRAQFRADGYLHIPGVLGAQEVDQLRAGVDAVFSDPRRRESNLYGDIVAVRLFETAPIFEDMVTREPIISLVESILGRDCHLIAENVVRNPPGSAIDQWHVDDAVVFPAGPGMARHDPRLEMPVFLLTVQIPLTDIPSDEYGPSQYVPGSHYSGRQPDDPPLFEGRGPQSIHCQAGDIYLHNGQTWHRGAPNASTRTRYLFQLHYGCRWVSQRFYPFINYRLPEAILERADQRRQRVFGVHPKGPYG